MFTTADQWYAHAKKLMDKINHFSDVLPEDMVADIERATELKDTSAAGIQQSCEMVRGKLGKMVKKLPAGGGVGGFVTSAVVTTVVGTGAAAVLYKVTSVDVTVTNNGCDTIPLADGVPPQIHDVAALLDANLPLGVLPGGSETITMPPVKFDFDIAPGSEVMMRVAGQSASFTIPSDVVSVTYDGEELLGKHTTFDLRDKKEHDIVITCN